MDFAFSEEHEGEPWWLRVVFGRRRRAGHKAALPRQAGIGEHEKWELVIVDIRSAVGWISLHDGVGIDHEFRGANGEGLVFCVVHRLRRVLKLMSDFDFVRAGGKLREVAVVELHRIKRQRIAQPGERDPGKVFAHVNLSSPLFQNHLRTDPVATAPGTDRVQERFSYSSRWAGLDTVSTGGGSARACPAAKTPRY